MKDLSQSIGERIAELRKEQHMTQAELAEYLDISVKHCSSVERGLSRLSLEKIIEVADLFHTSLDYLICGRCAPGQYADLLPASLQETLNSGDEEQASLLRRFLQLYGELLEVENKRE